MTKKQEKLTEIIEDIFKLNTSIDNTREKQINDFIFSAVNGDNPISHLVIDANLGNNNKGIIAYILTNLRLIKIDIGEKEIESTSFPLSTIIGIERKLIEDNRAQFSIAFQNGSFGLRYSQDNKKINDFFQKIDQMRPT